MESYENLLDSAYKRLIPIEKSSDRFEVPKIEGHIEGNKTILTNLQAIAAYLRRDCNHILKYLLKGLATSGTFKNKVVVLQRKISSQKINEKIEEYVKEFVYCKECKKPDTELIRDKSFAFIHCLACGAKHSVRSKL